MMIRLFEKTDSLACAEVIKKSVQHTHADYYTKEQIASLLRLYSQDKFKNLPSAQVTYVSIKNGKIVGVGSVLRDKLKGLYVDPQCLGSGLGKSLLKVLEDVVTANGISRITTFASLNASGFYSSQGYERISDHMDEKGPAIVMRKELR